MTDEKKPQPVFFTFYFDAGFCPDDTFLDMKKEFVTNILWHKIKDQGLDPADYEEMEVMNVGGNALMPMIVNAGNLWRERVNCVRIARFPKNYEGNKGFASQPKAITEQEMDRLPVPTIDPKSETLQ